MNFFISTASADVAPMDQSSSIDPLDFVFPIILLVLFYMMLIRPQSKRAKEHRVMQQSLLKGDEVVTDGGIMGRIIDIADNAVTMEIAKGIEVKVRRESINSVLPKGTLGKL
ncbi:MAG: preprotein translocase subunit YajC [Piscirickettsiaceae bacterium]|nr:preprotein translocase subunit YajC [Piscirickettsiaceae bacterium]